MKRSIAAAAAVVLLVALAGCGGEGGSGASVSTEEAKEAFGVSFVAVMMASFSLAFGQEISGVSLDPETDELTLDKFNLADLFDDPDAAEELGYSAISGTVNNVNDEMVANLSLEGGPVKTIEFTLGEAELQASEGFTTTVKINGKEMEIELAADDFEG